VLPKQGFNILRDFSRRIIMCKRLSILISFILLLGLVGSASAQLPEGWQSQDINTTDGGSAEVIDGTWTISGGGGDVWGSSDEFHYVYTELTGDVDIIAQVVSNGTGSNTWAKGGVMIRETTDPGSKHMIMALTGSDGGGIGFQGRPVTDDRSNSYHGDVTAAPPHWVRLTREGNTITGYHSADGVTWELFTDTSPDGAQTNPIDVEMADPVLVGLFVTSHAAGEIRTYTFDNVSLEGLEDPNPVGWWPLNEGAGDIAIDVSGRGNDGTINNPNGGLGLDGSVWVDDPVRGTVISFNGTVDGAFVRAGNVPQMTLTNNFTWSFWAKHSDENTADNDIILGNRMDENAADFVPRQFIKFTPTKFEWHMNGNGDDNLEYDDIEADVWLHHAVVKAADQLTYYRNGIKASLGTFTQPLDLPQPLFFGGDNEGSAGENWAGLMSDVRIYNRALTELEIVAAAEGVEQVDMEIGFATPVIDGEVDNDWEGVSTQYFVPLDDPANASGSWKALYDSENLYVLVDMTDDSLQNDSASSWQDDSVEIYFDGGNTKVDTPLSGDDHQYTFGWTTDDVQGTNVDGYTEGIEHAQVDTDTGWRIEVKLPWLSIQGAAPQARDLIGIDCYYNDDDDGGDSRENKLLSFSTVEGWNDASQWGTAVLGVTPEPVDPGSTDLLAWWTCDEGAGAVVGDASGNGRDGTFVNGDPAWVEGVQGSAVELVGPTVIETPPLDLELSEATMAGWIKPNGAQPDWSSIIMQRDPGLATGFNVLGFQLAYHWNDTSDSWSFRGGDMIAEDDWTFAAVTIEPDKATFYVNGEAGSVNKITHEPALWNSNVYLGGDGTAGWVSRRMNGALDEVVMYDRALSVGEIRYLAGHRKNLALNPSFEDDEPILDDPDWVQWCTWNPAEGAGSNVTIVDTDAVDGARSLKVEPVGPENWHFILVNISFAADLSKNYTASFWAKAEAARPLTVQMKASDNSVNAWNATGFDLTTDWAEYSYTSEVQHTDVKLEFLCAESEVPFLLDSVSVSEAQ